MPTPPPRLRQGGRHRLYVGPGHAQSVAAHRSVDEPRAAALLWFGTNGSFTFGGAKPVPVNPRKYRKFIRGDIIVSGAGVVTNLVLALLWAVVFVVLGLVGAR